MDETAHIALNRVWTLVAGVLAALAALPGMAGACLPGPVWARAFAELRLAEAAARRALFVLAAAEPAPCVPAPSAMPPAPEAAPGLSSTLSPKKTARSPAPFALSDRVADVMDLAGLAETRGMARPIVSTGAPRPIAGLKARMAALQAVLDDPGPALARFIARRDWPRRHIFDRSTAPCLKPGYPPGFDPRRALEWAMDVVMEIHTRALQGRASPPGGPADPAPCPAA
ncbi:MAG: hypothetical protein AAFQ22_10350 [Pseudomonadota bacterium]